MTLKPLVESVALNPRFTPGDAGRYEDDVKEGPANVVIQPELPPNEPVARFVCVPATILPVEEMNSIVIGLFCCWNTTPVGVIAMAPV